jgi:hypothetical protein
MSIGSINALFTQKLSRELNRTPPIYQPIPPVCPPTQGRHIAQLCANNPRFHAPLDVQAAAIPCPACSTTSLCIFVAVSLIKEYGLRWGTHIRQLNGVLPFAFFLQMDENLVNDCRVFNARDDFNGFAALATNFDVM